MEREKEAGQISEEKEEWENVYLCICVIVWPVHLLGQTSPHLSSLLFDPSEQSEWKPALRLTASGTSRQEFVLAPVIAAGWDFYMEGATKKHVIIIFVDGEFWVLHVSDPSMQWVRAVHTLSWNSLASFTSASNNLEKENTQYQIIHHYQHIEDQLSELFSPPRWCCMSLYFALLTLNPNQTAPLPVHVIHTAEDKTAGHVWGVCGLARVHTRPSLHWLLSREGDHELITAFTLIQT